MIHKIELLQDALSSGRYYLRAKSRNGVVILYGKCAEKHDQIRKAKKLAVQLWGDVYMEYTNGWNGPIVFKAYQKTIIRDDALPKDYPNKRTNNCPQPRWD